MRSKALSEFENAFFKNRILVIKSISDAHNPFVADFCCMDSFVCAALSGARKLFDKKFQKNIATACKI
jgi:hypothetical protein